MLASYTSMLMNMKAMKPCKSTLAKYGSIHPESHELSRILFTKSGSQINDGVHKVFCSAQR